MANEYTTYDQVGKKEDVSDYYEYNAYRHAFYFDDQIGES